MRLLLLLVSFYLLAAGNTANTFRENKLRCTRIREAYNDKWKCVEKVLADQSLSRDSLRIYLRAFKTEKVIEVWAKNVSDSVYKQIRELPICDISGDVGPKRRSHDLQAPEGFYYISDLNPYSRYYLSLGINYPNASDSVRGVRGHLGNEIYIHGFCISSGCLAITNERIKELFIYCIEAYNSGQEKIEISIYPARLDDKTYSGLISDYKKRKDWISLWEDLKKGYDLFNQKKVPPLVKFNPDGTHEVK